jgi:3-hydroxyisobutyrate dehydrogenase
MDHEVKDLTLFDDLGKKYDVPLEMSPLAVQIMRDGLAKFGPRVWSSMVVKRLEDACGEDLRAPGFPQYLTDEEPEAAGVEIKPRQAREI